MTYSYGHNICGGVTSYFWTKHNKITNLMPVLLPNPELALRKQSDHIMHTDGFGLKHTM